MNAFSLVRCERREDWKAFGRAPRRGGVYLWPELLEAVGTDFDPCEETREGE